MIRVLHADDQGRRETSRASADHAEHLSRLTERECEVLALVAEGLSNEELARRLLLSPLTTKTHVSRIMTKLEARDRAQPAVIAYESGLVTPARRPSPPKHGHRPLGPMGGGCLLLRRGTRTIRGCPLRMRVAARVRYGVILLELGREDHGDGDAELLGSR